MVDQDSYKSVQDHFRHWWSRVGMDAVADVAAEDAITIDETLNKVIKLPSKYKTVVYMYYYEGYSTVELQGFLGRRFLP